MKKKLLLNLLLKQILHLILNIITFYFEKRHEILDKQHTLAAHRCGISFFHGLVAQPLLYMETIEHICCFGSP
jgi:hypothetical protein